MSTLQNRNRTGMNESAIRDNNKSKEREKEKEKEKEKERQKKNSTFNRQEVGKIKNIIRN